MHSDLGATVFFVFPSLSLMTSGPLSHARSCNVWSLERTSVHLSANCKILAINHQEI